MKHRVITHQFNRVVLWRLRYLEFPCKQLQSLRHRVHHHDIVHVPQASSNARFHRMCCLDGLVNLHEVVDHEIEADCVHVVFQLAESIG